MTGIIPRPWIDSDIFHLTDRYGNEISLPTSAVWSLLFSVISMVKTMIYLNTICIHSTVNISLIFLIRSLHKFAC